LAEGKVDMDLVDLIREKRFLGQEFLTWLWYQCELNSGLIQVKDFGTVEIWFEERMVLDSGRENQRQSVTCQGRDLSLAEARTALRQGKKVSQARLRLASADYEWRMTIKAESLEITGLSLPRTLDPRDENKADLAGRLLDRVALIQEITGFIDKLFAQFISIRLSDNWAEKELAGIRRWLIDQSRESA